MNTKGITVSTKQASLIFNKETEVAYQTIIDEELEPVDQKKLVGYLCKQSWENTRKAQRSGKKSIRYCSVMIKFATFVRSKMGNSAYDFLSVVYNLPSNSTLNQYDTLDTNAEDGIMHQTLADMQHDFDKYYLPSSLSSQISQWKRSGLLKFDEMKIKEKIVFNPFTKEIIGFEEGACNTDVIKAELMGIINCDAEIDTSENIEREKPSVAKHILLFMFIRWDKEGSSMKRVVARYSVDKSTGEDLCNKIRNIIRALAARGFIVNQVASDGATENVSAMKQIATITAKEVFADLDPSLPQDILVAFPHPSFSSIMVYIGGEMPHWVKKFVNAMDNSSFKKEKRDLTFRGAKINLGMIEDVWRQQTGGINMLRTNKLTDEHFIKNAHSRMRVHLSVQVLSLSVFEMLKKHCHNNDGRTKDYASLMLIVQRLNTVVDVWNHPTTKTFKCIPNGVRYESIDSSQHEYIKYLEDVLSLFSEWYSEIKISKNVYQFIPKTLYESFAWLVYGIKGVSLQIPNGCRMVQCRGGTDDVEHEFARNRQKNSNPTMADMRGQIARGTGVRSSDFARHTKNNTSGDKRVFYKELLTSKKKKK